MWRVNFAVIGLSLYGAYMCLSAPHSSLIVLMGLLNLACAGYNFGIGLKGCLIEAGK